MFQDVTNNNKRFAIVKPLMCIVGDSEDYAMLNPVAPYVPQTRRQREAVKELVLGEKPPTLATVIWVTKLKEFDIPKAMKTILDMPVLKEKTRLMKSGFVPRSLEPDTHTRHFHVLLHMEEQKSA
jgi:helicase MOV-10